MVHINARFVLVFFMTNFLTFALGQDCDPSTVEACVGEMKQLYQNQDGPIIVKNEAELQTLCSHQQRALTCINNFVDRCLTESHRTLYNNLTAGVQDFIADFCMVNSNTRKVYIKHLSCFNKVADKVHHCSLRLTEFQKTSHTKNQDRETYLSDTCCHFGSAMECMITVVQDGCPEEAHQLFSNMVNKITKQFTRVAQCDVNLANDYSQCNTATWTSLSFSVLLAGLAAVLFKRS